MDALTLPDQVTEKLLSFELILAKLYDTFAERFPEQQQFWLDIARQEKGHAKVLRKFDRFISERPDMANVVLGRFPLNLIKSTHDRIQDFIDQANDPDFTLVKALEAAVQIERTIIEQKFYEVYDSDNEQIKILLTLLTEESIQHAQKIKNKLKELRQYENS